MSKRKEISDDGGQPGRSTRSRPNLQPGLDSDAENDGRATVHSGMDPLEVRGMVKEVGVENLSSVFEEYSPKKQKIDLLAIIVYQPKTERQRQIKHTFLRLRNVDLNTIMDCVEGEDVSGPGSALPSRWKHSVRVIKGYHKMLEENSDKNFREAIALNLLQALTLFKCLYSTRGLADYIPSQQAWYEEAMALAQAKYQRQAEGQQVMALRGLTANGGSATFAVTSSTSAASGGEGQVEKTIEGKLEKGDPSRAPGSFIPDDRLLMATGGFMMSSEMVDVTVDVQEWTDFGSVLLFGPPGTRKTRLVTQLHYQLGCNLVELQPSDFNDKFVGGSEKIITALFQVAAANQPCIVFIDEIDALLQHRSARDPGHEKYLTAKFLEEMSKIAKDKVDILICGATSLPWDIDVAAIRRFNRAILIDVPSLHALQKIFRFYLDQIHHDISTDDLQRLVNRFYGVTGDEVNKGIGSLLKSGFRELLQNKRKERRWSKHIVCGKAVWCVDPSGDTENSYAAIRLLGEQLWPKPVTFEALSTVMTQRGMSVTREVRLKYSRWDTKHQM